MADKKITELSSASSVIDADVFPLVTDTATTPVTKKVSWSSIKTSLAAVFSAFAHNHTGGSESKIPEGGLVLADNTTNDATASKHGFLPKLSGSASTFLAGDGTYDYLQKADGWVDAEDTWVYVSSTSFKINGKDLTGMFQKGTKIYLVQSSTVKYFYVVGVTFSTNTTVAVTGGSAYSLTNTTISSPRYSYAATPQGFPDTFAWAPTPTGFSVVPGSSSYQFRIDGRQVTFNVHQGTDGTSNLTTFTIPLPVTAAAGTSWQGTNGFAVNGGTALTGASRWYIAGGGTAIDLYTDMVSGAWSNTGGKRARLQGFYLF